MNQKNHFVTYDMSLSATLVALGHTLGEIQKEDSGRSKFFFKHTSKLKKDVFDYWKQELKVNPHSIFDSLKFIKSRLYSGVNG